MNETFMAPEVHAEQVPFNQFFLTFGVYDQVVFQILFYLIALTIVIACIYLNTYLLKKLIALFSKNKF